MKLFIVDKQALFREGLIWMLRGEPDVEVIGHVGSGQEAVEKAAELRPDVLLLENLVPDGPAYTLIPSLHVQCSTMKIILLAHSDQEAFLTEAIRCGVTGYLLKDISFSTFVSSLKSLGCARSGKIQGNEEGSFERMIDEHKSSPRAGLIDPPLTDRDLQILHHLGNGATNQEIADLLGISVSTVKTNIRRIYNELGLKNRREAKIFSFNSTRDKM